MTNYIHKYKTVTMTPVPTDTNFNILSYLSDETGLPFSDNGSFDTFDVLVTDQNSQGYDLRSYLHQAATQAIINKYKQTLSGNVILGSNIMTGLSDTSGVYIGMQITGEEVPIGTVVSSIRDVDSVVMSDVATADKENETYEFSPATWNIDYGVPPYTYTTDDTASVNQGEIVWRKDTATGPGEDDHYYEWVNSTPRPSSPLINEDFTTADWSDVPIEPYTIEYLLRIINFDNL